MSFAAPFQPLAWVLKLESRWMSLLRIVTMLSRSTGLVASNTLIRASAYAISWGGEALWAGELDTYSVCAICKTVGKANRQVRNIAGWGGLAFVLGEGRH